MSDEASQQEHMPRKTDEQDAPHDRTAISRACQGLAGAEGAFS